MATRQFDFIVGPETSTLPTVSDPSDSADLVTLSYADKTYTNGKVATLAALKAVAATARTDNLTLFVDALQAFFQFDSASSTTGNDISVVAPTSGTGRWIRVPYANSTAWYTPQQTVAAVKAIDATERQDKQIIWLDDLTNFFYFDSASSDTGDDVTVITPTSGSGRWKTVPANTTNSQLLTTDTSTTSVTVASGTSLFHPNLTIAVANTYTINGEFVGVNSVIVNGTFVINGLSRIL